MWRPQLPGFGLQNERPHYNLAVLRAARAGLPGPAGTWDLGTERPCSGGPRTRPLSLWRTPGRMQQPRGGGPGGFCEELRPHPDAGPSKRLWSHQERQKAGAEKRLEQATDVGCSTPLLPGPPGAPISRTRKTFFSVFFSFFFSPPAAASLLTHCLAAS